MTRITIEHNDGTVDSVEYNFKVPAAMLDFLKVMVPGAEKHGLDSWLTADGPKTGHEAMHDSMFHHLSDSRNHVRADHETGLDPLLHLACRAIMRYVILQMQTDVTYLTESEAKEFVGTLLNPESSNLETTLKSRDIYKSVITMYEDIIELEDCFNTRYDFYNLRRGMEDFIESYEEHAPEFKIFNKRLQLRDEGDGLDE